MTTLLRRIALLAFLFALELTAVTLWLDNAQLNGRRGLTAGIRDYGPEILRAIVGFAAVFVAIGITRYRRALAEISSEAADIPVSPALLLGHFASMAAFLLLSSRLYSDRASSDAIAVAWLAAGLGAIALGTSAFFRFRFLTRLVTATGSLWMYALAAGVAASFSSNLSRSIWPATTRLTFAMVRMALGLLVPVVSDVARMNIGTPRFSVEIAPECSGLEGVGLMLVFGCVWLAIFRRECRFPQALLLLPAGGLFVFVLNSARITALILMGNAGAERIALGGFHSQAGWMVFNLGAIGFAMTAGRARWITMPAAVRPAVNRNAVWVLPLVAVLGAGMIAHALTGDFEWPYPLRFFAAVAVIWHYREMYAALDWRVGWQGPAMGVLVFAIWMALDRDSGGTIPSALTSAGQGTRIGWIAFRALASSVTVPFAEELAFRGFLLRRLVSSDFETVSFPMPGFPWVAIAISSVAFGLLHGNRWLAGTLAGVCYALVYMRGGRIGEAVVAHGVTNALIAVEVLVLGQWHLW